MIQAPNAILTLLLLALGLSLPQLAHAGASAAGVWEFDSSQKQIYVDSIRAKQTNQNMAEIAVSMGLSWAEGSSFELGREGQQLFLKITDKATNKSETAYITVEKSPSEEKTLIVREKLTGAVHKLKFVDDDHMILYRDGSAIPLERLISSSS